MPGIGLLGGSFNPAHGAHRAVSLRALARLGLDEVWWLVSPGNPLKPQKGMASLEARFAAAAGVARGAPIRVTAIEQEMGSRYTVDTIRSLKRRYPDFQFIWLMGMDNLGQFHRWRDWRGIARALPIAVVTRLGYAGAGHRAPALGWLRRFVRPAADASHWTRWRLPSIVLLELPPDPRSATAIRAARPAWHEEFARSFNPGNLRDAVTRRRLNRRRPFAPKAIRST